MVILRKYGAATNVYVPIVKRAVVDFAVGADWTPAAGDVKISKDGGAAANITTLPVAIAMGNGAMWNFAISATEMQAAKIVITVADSATKAIEDQAILIDTYGNASAEHAVDLDDSVRAGLTALPNAAAEAAGGLYTRGSGAGQINQPANGQVDANVAALAAAVITAAKFAAGAVDANALAADAANEVADALLDRAAGVETGYTPRQALRIILAALAGKLSGAATTNVLIRDVLDTKNRVNATVDADGNRSAVTLDGS